MFVMSADDLAMDLIKGLLAMDPAKRLSPAQALAHPVCLYLFMLCTI
jgi:serine/threonine protein kinase